MSHLRDTAFARVPIEVVTDCLLPKMEGETGQNLSEALDLTRNERVRRALFETPVKHAISVLQKEEPSQGQHCFGHAGAFKVLVVLPPQLVVFASQQLEDKFGKDSLETWRFLQVFTACSKDYVKKQELPAHSGKEAEIDPSSLLLANSTSMKRTLSYEVYLLLCVLDWFLPKFCKVHGISTLTLGLVRKHDQHRGTLVPRHLKTVGNRMVHDSARRVGTKNALEETIYILFQRLHPVHHLMFALELINCVQNHYETRYILPCVSSIAGVIHDYSDSRFVSVVDDRVHELPNEFWSLCMQSEERNVKEKLHIQAYLDKVEKASLDELSEEEMCDFILHVQQGSGLLL